MADFCSIDKAGVERRAKEFTRLMNVGAYKMAEEVIGREFELFPDPNHACHKALVAVLRTDHENYSDPRDPRFQTVAMLRLKHDQAYTKSEPGTVWGGETNRLERDL